MSGYTASIAITTLAVAVSTANCGLSEIETSLTLTDLAKLEGLQGMIRTLTTILKDCCDHANLELARNFPYTDRSLPFYISSYSEAEKFFNSDEFNNTELIIKKKYSNAGIGRYRIQVKNQPECWNW